MAVKIRVTTERKEYVTTEVTLSDEEYRKLREDLHGDGHMNGAKDFRQLGDELLDHPTAKHFDSWGGDESLISVTDTFEDETYTD